MIFKLFGAALLLGFSLLVLRAYKAYLGRRKEECEGFGQIIDAVRDGVDYFLSPIGRIIERFESGESMTAKFAENVKSGDSPEKAFDKIKEKLAIGREGREILGKFFASVGRGYKDGAVKIADACRKKFTEYTEKTAEEDEKSAKLTTALVIGGALGLILLFI
ncbi:MAG: hypothetical protein IJE25_01185 [Clostridia bacterium]|nr:hypothetical protein [Clostridia bacterium]